MIDTRELSRRPGSQRVVEREAPAPSDLGVELLAVPAGTAISLSLRLESVMEGVLVTGTADAELQGECARCLDSIEDDISVDIQELFVYAESDAEDDEASRIQDDLIDLEPVLRDAVVLALPFSPLCVPECPGLCPDCGLRLADDPQHAHDEAVDPRWSTLRDFSAGPSGLSDLSTEMARSDHPVAAPPRTDMQGVPRGRS